MVSRRSTTILAIASLSLLASACTEPPAVVLVLDAITASDSAKDTTSGDTSSKDTQDTTPGDTSTPDTQDTTPGDTSTTDTEPDSPLPDVAEQDIGLLDSEPGETTVGPDTTDAQSETPPPEVPTLWAASPVTTIYKHPDEWDLDTTAVGATNSDAVALATYGNQNGMAIVAVRVSAAGENVSDHELVTLTDGFYGLDLRGRLAVAPSAISGDYLVAFAAYHASLQGSSGGAQIRLARLTSAGFQPLAPVGDPDAWGIERDRPVIAPHPAGGWVMAFVGDTDTVYWSRINEDGSVNGSPVPLYDELPDESLPTVKELAITATPNGHMIAFLGDGNDSDSDAELYVLAVGLDGQPIGTPTRVSPTDSPYGGPMGDPWLMSLSSRGSEAFFTFTTTAVGLPFVFQSMNTNTMALSPAAAIDDINDVLPARWSATFPHPTTTALAVVVSVDGNPVAGNPLDGVKQSAVSPGSQTVATYTPLDENTAGHGIDKLAMSSAQAAGGRGVVVYVKNDRLRLINLTAP